MNLKTLLLSAVAAVGIVSGAQAADITLTLNDGEQQALIQLLDVAVRSGGLVNNVAENGNFFYKKIIALQAAAAAPPPPTAADVKGKYGPDANGR